MDYSDSEGELESLFHNPDPRAKHAFKFEAMDMAACERAESEELGGATKVTFRYSYGPDVCISSTLIVPIPPPLDLLQSRLLLYVGMNVLTWYWMGYATHKIVILSGAASPPLTDQEIIYFEELYNNCLAEFNFVNKLRGPRISVENQSAQGGAGVAEKVRVEAVDTSVRPRRIQLDSDTVLIPLGGGKDSLVVWELAALAARPVAFIYVSDGPYEFEGNSRLAALVRACGEGTADAAADGLGVVLPSAVRRSSQSSTSIQSPKCFVFRHDFRSPIFEATAHSHTPTGHPWAALCLFDSLLLAELLQLSECWLGFEESADEGNGMMWQGIEVNHQYDKSDRFVRMTKSFIQWAYNRFGSDGNASSSLLRIPPSVSSPLSLVSELLIARRFALSPHLKRMHSLFLSCNEPVKNANGACATCVRDISISSGVCEWEWQWCMRCEKCAFVSLLLNAWLPANEVVEAIGWDVLSDSSTSSKCSILPCSDEGSEEVQLRNHYEEQRRQRNREQQRQILLALCGAPGTVKPFECVGTAREGRAAALLSKQRRLGPSERRGAAGGEAVSAVLCEMTALSEAETDDLVEGGDQVGEKLKEAAANDFWLMGMAPWEMDILRSLQLV